MNRREFIKIVAGSAAIVAAPLPALTFPDRKIAVDAISQRRVINFRIITREVKTRSV